MPKCSLCGQNKPEEAFYCFNYYSCKECNYTPSRKASIVAAAHKRWARESGVLYERVDLRRLYERDKGTCGICKQPVAWEDASHDLITPRSKGGPSTWVNSQLTHRWCNVQKGRK